MTAQSDALMLVEKIRWLETEIDRLKNGSSQVALTAAAEVGESLEPTLIVQGGGAQYGGHTPREEKRIVAATIERCAQVAHDWLKHHGYEIEAIECAAAIRAMKKK